MISGTSKEMKAPRVIQPPRVGSSPHVEIVEQPASKAIRFRYECEGRRSAGSIPGANSAPDKRTFPTIRVTGYRGSGVVVVSCVTKDEPYRPHPHSLVGKDTCNRGICRVEITPGKPEVKFPNLGIQCVKRKDVYEALELREELRVDPFRTGFGHKTQAASVDLNCVRLCFQAFVEGSEGKINVPLRPVVSEPIYDKKSMSDLVICRMSHGCATAEGGMEMVVLCEKVAKDNIQVRFLERDAEGRHVWEGYGDLKSMDVHKQVAIVFRTPSYGHRRLEEPLQVYVQLRRPTDGVTSEPWPFRMLPINDALEPNSLRRKRRKLADGSKTQLLRQLQARAEKDEAPGIPNDPASRDNPRFDPTRFEPTLQPFPVASLFPVALDLIAPGGNRSTPGNSRLPVDVSGYGAQVSSPMTHGSHDTHGDFSARTLIPSQADAGGAGPQLLHGLPADMCGADSSALNFYRQTQLRYPSLPIQPRDFESPEEPDDEAAVGGNAAFAPEEPCNLDTSLNIQNLIDSAELAAYSAALSGTLSSSGLSINDGCAKKETNGTMHLGPSASWCAM